MKLNNQQIYEYAEKLSVFSNCNIKIPVRINFYLQKNIKTIQQAAIEIDKIRLQLGAEYGTYNQENKCYNIRPENLQEVNRELNDLLRLEQDLNIHIFKLEDFEGIELEYQQMAAIMFMIEE